MKRFTLSLLAGLMVSAGIAFTATPGLAASRCDHPSGMIDQRACAKAAEGSEALRRFVERTRMIYSLYFYDYARDEVAAVADGTSTPPGRVADAAGARP